MELLDNNLDWAVSVDEAEAEAHILGLDVRDLAVLLESAGGEIRVNPTKLSTTTSPSNHWITRDTLPTGEVVLRLLHKPGLS